MDGALDCFRPSRKFQCLTEGSSRRGLVKPVGGTGSALGEEGKQVHVQGRDPGGPLGARDEDGAWLPGIARIPDRAGGHNQEGGGCGGPRQPELAAGSRLRSGARGVQLLPQLGYPQVSRISKSF